MIDGLLYNPAKRSKFLAEALCFKGGGGSSGKVDWPNYIKHVHCMYMTGDLSTMERNFKWDEVILPTPLANEHTLPYDIYVAQQNNPYVYRGSSEELVTNGDCSESTAVGWTLGDAGWTYDALNDKITHNGAASYNAALSQTLQRLSQSTVYKVVFTVLGQTAGTVQVSIGSVSGRVVSSSGTYTEYIIVGTGKDIVTAGGIRSLNDYMGFYTQYIEEKQTYETMSRNIFDWGDYGDLVEKYPDEFWDREKLNSRINLPWFKNMTRKVFPDFEKWLEYQPSVSQPTNPNTDIGLISVTYNDLAFTPSTDFDGSITDVSVILSEEVQNPNAIAYDPSIPLENMQGQADSHNALVQNLNPYVDWSAFLALTKRESQQDGLFDVAGVSSKVRTIMDQAFTDAGKMASSAQSVDQAAINGIIDSAMARASAYLATITTDGLTLVNRAMDQAFTTSEKAFGLAATSARTEMDAGADSAKAKASSYLSNLTGEAATAAGKAIDDDLVKAGLDSFERIARTKHLENVSRFAAGMDDINAVMGSAFVFGMAKMERDFQNAIVDKETQLKIDVFRQVFQNYLESHIRYALGMMDLYRAHQMSKIESMQRLGDTGLKSGIDQADAKLRYSAQGTDIYRFESERILNRFESVFSAQLKTYLMEREAQQRFVNEGVARMVDANLRRVELSRAAAALQAEISRMTIVAKSEEQKQNLEIDAQEAIWDLETWNYAMNMLSAQHGGGPGSSGARKANPIASALGGALSGAVAGAMVGNMVAPAVAAGTDAAGTAIAASAGGGPIGAGIGLILGAAAGYLGS